MDLIYRYRHAMRLSVPLFKQGKKLSMLMRDFFVLLLLNLAKVVNQRALQTAGYRSDLIQDEDPYVVGLLKKAQHI